MSFKYVLIILVIIVIVGCEADPPIKQSVVEIPFRTDGTLSFLHADQTLAVKIALEIAADDSSRARGLMQRGSLPDKSGMLFIFDTNEPRSFWMANTPLSLDIIYVNEALEIVKIAKYTKPFSPDHVESGAPAKYVIEVSAGFCDTYGILAADRVTYEDYRQ